MRQRHLDWAGRNARREADLPYHVTGNFPQADFTGFGLALQGGINQLCLRHLWARNLTKAQLSVGNWACSTTMTLAVPLVFSSRSPHWSRIAPDKDGTAKSDGAAP